MIKAIYTSKIKCKNSEELMLHILDTRQISEYTKLIAEFRIKYFRAYPYLYAGVISIEEHYITGFAQDHQSLLAIITKEDVMVGISTALPLNSKADILGSAPILFANNGHKIDQFYYISEVIIRPDYQGQGLAKQTIALQEIFAKKYGYSQFALATVVRDEDDSRKPMGYLGSDLVWEKMGYKKSNMRIEYEWPTILENGSVENV
jgi:GNAT superfamily N-acetyltransferase